MKRIFLVCLLFLLCLTVRAALVSSNLLTYASISASTNDCSTVILGTVFTPQVTYSIQHGVLSATNALEVDFRYGFGNSISSMTNIYTWFPTTTNAAIESVTLTNSGVLYVFVNPSVKATNTLSVGAQSIQQQ